MTEKYAFELMQQYMNGWKQNNLHFITSCLLENCIVIESHGPTYHGMHDIKLWFKFWLAADSNIVQWDIRSFAFRDKEQTAFCEWDFVCVSNSTRYAFAGISVIKFAEEKIAFIHEYRMSQPAYDWRGNELISE